MSQQTAREDSGSGSAAERVGVKMRGALLPMPSDLFADGNRSVTVMGSVGIYQMHPHQ